jgi:hypothetical protein
MEITRDIGFDIILSRIPLIKSFNRSLKVNGLRSDFLVGVLPFPKLQAYVGDLQAKLGVPGCQLRHSWWMLTFFIHHNSHFKKTILINENFT